MVYTANEYYLKVMAKGKLYGFPIEAINGNGVSQRSKVIKTE